MNQRDVPACRVHTCSFASCTPRLRCDIQLPLCQMSDPNLRDSRSTLRQKNVVKVERTCHDTRDVGLHAEIAETHLSTTAYGAMRLLHLLAFVPLVNESRDTTFFLLTLRTKFLLQRTTKFIEITGSERKNFSPDQAAQIKREPITFERIQQGSRGRNSFCCA